MNPNTSDAHRPAAVRAAFPRLRRAARPTVRTPFSPTEPVDVPLSGGGTFRMDRADHDRITALPLFGGRFPRCYRNDNGRGFAYVRFNLPNATGRDNNGMLARLILGADAAGKRVCYRDGDRANLTRGNLYAVSGRGGPCRQADALAVAGDQPQPGN